VKKPEVRPGSRFDAWTMNQPIQSSLLMERRGLRRRASARLAFDFLNLALKRIGGGQIAIGGVYIPTSISRFVVQVRRSVSIAEAKFRITPDQIPRSRHRIARTQPHRLLNIGLRLLKKEKIVLCDSSNAIPSSVVRIDG